LVTPDTELVSVTKQTVEQRNKKFMFKLLCRKSSEEATKERKTFFNLLKDAQVLLVDV